MKNFIKAGKTLTLTSPGAVSSGAAALIGDVFGVATADVGAGKAGEFITEGVFDLAKTSAQAWVLNDPIYWDVTNKKADNTPTVGPRIGFALAVAANPSATGRVVLAGHSVLRPKLTSVQTNSPAPVSLNTAGPVTLTAAQVLAGIVVADTNGAGRVYTLPTAALLVAAIPNAAVGDVVRCKVINGADGAEAITITEGAGGTWDGNFLAAKTIAQNFAKDVLIRLTNVTAAAEAYVVYLG